mgnify:FL=1
MKEKPDIMCIDHLHYFARGNKGATEEIDRIIVRIQVMAKELEIPILIISHLRKLNSDKTPTLDDLKDSVSLSQIPAVVCLIQREKNDPDLQIDEKFPSIYENKGKIIIAKNRIQGKTGILDFTINQLGVISFSGYNNYVQQVSEQNIPL